MQMPPSNAPSMLPMPPSTTITNAISTKLSPTVGNTENSGIIMQAARPTSAEPPAKVMQEDAGNRDAHELRRLAVLHGRADRLAEIGRLQHDHCSASVQATATAKPISSSGLA